MQERLRDRVAIVTGGGTGIGAAIARKLAGEGAAVVLAQPGPGPAERLAAELEAGGARACALDADVSRNTDVERLLRETAGRFGRLDVLVNNAAVTGKPALAAFLEATEEHWNRMLAVNLTGAFLCARAAARHMVLQGEGGVIVNISSVGADAAQEHAAAYCVSKAGLDALTRSIAIELAPHRIRAVSIAPGDILTETSAEILEEARAGGASGRFARHTPLGRRGSPEEIAEVVAFVASDAGSFVTGCSWRVDGGFLAY